MSLKGVVQRIAWVYLNNKDVNIQEPELGLDFALELTEP